MTATVAHGWIDTLVSELSLKEMIHWHERLQIYHLI